MKKMLLIILLLCTSIAALTALADYTDGLDAEKRGDYHAAIKEYTPLATKGDVEAQLNLGFIYATYFNDFKQAYHWYSLAAEKKNPKAFASLGLFYLAGTGVPRNYDKAIQYLRQAAEAGNLYGMSNLGVALLAQAKKPGNLKEGLYWMQQASDNGDAIAQYNMGLFYTQGLYVKKDVLRGADYYTRAAAQGEVAAMTNLGLLYMRGDHPDFLSDYAKAYQWLSLAALQGSTQAKHALINLKKKMNHAQTVQAEQSVQKYLQQQDVAE